MISRAKTFLKISTKLLIRVLPGNPFRVARNFLWRSIGFDVSYSANIMSNAELMCGRIHIGDHVFIGNEVLITGGEIEIGECCDIAPRCTIHGGSHELGLHGRRAGKAYFGKVIIGSGTWVGTNSTIIDGAIIGAGCIVAAGSLVKAGIYPDDVLLAGNPAQVKRKLSSN
jgi:acetyltransferase-like isoleucine patch superfamily enzyme